MPVMTPRRRLMPAITGPCAQASKNVAPTKPTTCKCTHMLYYNNLQMHTFIHMLYNVCTLFRTLSDSRCPDLKLVGGDDLHAHDRLKDGGPSEREGLSHGADCGLSEGQFARVNTMRHSVLEDHPHPCHLVARQQSCVYRTSYRDSQLRVLLL